MGDSRQQYSPPQKAEALCLAEKLRPTLVDIDLGPAAMSVSVMMMAIGSQLSSPVVTTSAVSCARRVR
jgi:hypothetical protein